MITPVLTVDQMRAAERAAMDTGISEWELMRRAGEGAAGWIARVAGGRAVTVLCGPGNNGGDGYVIAQALRRGGSDVNVIAPKSAATETAQIARAAFDGDVQKRGVLRTPVVVDCLFGYGLSRVIEGEFADLLEELASTHCYKVAVDVPSSIAADTGTALGPLVQYDLTIALGAFKPAHFMMPHVPLMGSLRCVDIRLDISDPPALLAPPPRIAAPAPEAHKYQRGLVAIVAGDMPGAPILAAQAAMRAGAGYVKLLSPYPVNALADLVVVEGDPAESLTDPRLAAVLVGPGLGRRDEALTNLSAALEAGRPCVIDADALHLLDPDLLEGCDSSCLCLTPHEGELAALCQAFDIDGDGKLAQARRLHDVTGMTILAKGPDTVLCSQGKTWLFERGSSWLSIAGTGDVLAGILAARLAVHGDPALAAREAVALHHTAARMAGPAFTAGVLANTVSAAMGALQ